MHQGAVPLLAALFVAGCTQPQAHLSATAKGGDPIPSDALKPDANPGSRATLRLGAGDPKKPPRGAIASTEFEVGLVYKKEANEVTIVLQVLGETLEREVYETQPDVFRILTATDDSFAPGIDLVRFPAQPGATWEWSGKVVYAGISRPATAQISLSQDGKDLLSDVRLKILADPGRPELQRQLRFWFSKGKGVVRREFGDVSARRPVGEEWQL